jgi:hypothetical protein
LARAFREWREKAWWWEKIMIIGQRMNSVGLFILKTMIIGHRMKLFILMPGDSGLPSPDTAARKKYVTRIILAAVLDG